jgi:hypothetical protein
MPAERDPRVTDLRRYRRERARAERAAAQQKPGRNAAGQNEPILGKRPKAGVFLVLVVAVLVGLWFLGRH